MFLLLASVHKSSTSNSQVCTHTLPYKHLHTLHARIGQTQKYMHEHAGEGNSLLDSLQGGLGELAPKLLFF